MQLINVGYLSTNYYILKSTKATLLVDAGWPGTLKQFVHLLQRKGFGLKDINYILVTHYHPDHAGLVQELKDAGAKLIAMECQRLYIPLLKNYIKPGIIYKEISPENNIALPTDATRGFLKNIGFDGEIIHTPGHSNDSVTLVLDSGEAFTGDLPVVYSPENIGAKNSWEALKANGATIAYPGHGNPLKL